MIKVGKEVLFVLVIALAVFIAGCQGGQSTTSSSSTPFIGGSEGLQVRFLENAPPSEILDNKQTPFDITLRVENVGETDVAVNNVKTTIGGLYPPDFGKSLLQSVLNRPVQGVKKDPEGGRISGGIDEITFSELLYQKNLEGNNVFPVQADTCYTYQTRAVGDYCMRQDMTKIIPGVCNVKGSKTVFNSGGPVQVVSLDESVGGKNTVILNFKIKTVGSGTFFKPTPGTAASCTKGDLQSEGFVTVTVDPGITGELRCSGWGGQKTKGVRLVNGEASVTCILGGINVDAVQKLNIKLDYNHLISTSTRLLVKHLPGDTGAAAPPPPGTQPQGAGPSVSLGGRCNSWQQCTTQGICIGRQECVNSVLGECAAVPSQQACPANRLDPNQASLISSRSGYCRSNAGGLWDDSRQWCDCPEGKVWNPAVIGGTGTYGKCVSPAPAVPPAPPVPQSMTKAACESGGNGEWKGSLSSGPLSDCQCDPKFSPSPSGCATDV